MYSRSYKDATIESYLQEEIMIITAQIPEGIKKMDYKKAISTAYKKEARRVTKLNGYYFRQCIAAYRLGKTL